jgi:SOS response associated peptidase (SRAP)
VIRRNRQTGEISIDPLRCGLIPYFCGGTEGKRRPINAKCETVRVLPTFRDAYRRRRCIVPVDGFFEWKTIKGQKGTSSIKRGEKSSAVRLAHCSGGAKLRPALWSWRRPLLQHPSSLADRQPHPWSLLDEALKHPQSLGETVSSEQHFLNVLPIPAPLLDLVEVASVGVSP